MRILLPAHAFVTQPRSGLHTAIWHTARELGARGHDVHVVATYVELHDETLQSLRAKNIHLHHVAQFNTHNLSKPAALLCFFAAVGLRLRHRFDWIYIVDTARTPFARCTLGAKLATRALAPDTPEIREIFTTGDWLYDRQRKDEEEHWSGRTKPLWYRLLSPVADLWFAVAGPSNHLQGVDVVFCQGRETLGFWQTRLPVPTIFLPNGIDTALFDAAVPDAHPAGQFVWLFVGRISRRKGLFQLLQAFQTVHRTHPNTELWIVGKGSLELTREAETIAARTPGKIRLLGELPHPQVASLMHTCDALVDPMIYQGWSSVAMEAQYCGKPVIVSRFGGSKDFVQDGVNGYVLDPRDEQALAQTMSTLLSEPARAEAMGKAGHEVIRSHFQWTHVGDILEQAFRQYA